MKLSLNKIVGLLITFVIGVMAIVTLAFNLCTVEVGGYYYSRVVSENGFDFLSFDSSIITDNRFVWAISLIGAMSLVTLLLGIVTVLTSGLMLLLKKYNGFSLILLNVTCTVFSLFYMIEGIVVRASLYKSISTAAFVPFILLTILLVAYFVCRYKIADDNGQFVIGKESLAPISAQSLSIIEQSKALGEAEGALYKVQGSVGRTLTVYENKCVMNTKLTARSLIVGNFTDGEKTIYYADLTSIQFKKGSSMLLGYLNFENASNQGNRRGGNWAANHMSENSFTFEQVLNDLMQEIAAYVKKRVEEYKEGKGARVSTVIQQQQSAGDELLKLKQLLDMGVITQEEFDTKKKELLGL